MVSVPDRLRKLQCNWCIISTLEQYLSYIRLTRIFRSSRSVLLHKKACAICILPLLHTLHFWLDIYQIDLVMNPVPFLYLTWNYLSVYLFPMIKQNISTLHLVVSLLWNDIGGCHSLINAAAGAQRGGMEGLQLGPVHTQSWMSVPSMTTCSSSSSHLSGFVRGTCDQLSIDNTEIWQ